MKIKTLSYVTMILAVVGIITLGLSTGARAVENETTQTRPTVEPKVTPTDEQTRKAERKSKAKDRLMDARLKACQARERSITNIMKRAAERGNKQVTFLTTMTERVEAFYAKKGKVLATYDEIVVDVAAKKAAAQAATAAIEADATGFDCSADNPKELIASFKTKLKTHQETMQAYRTSVKNLMVGVKSVQGEEASRKEIQR